MIINVWILFFGGSIDNYKIYEVTEKLIMKLTDMNMFFSIVIKKSNHTKNCGKERLKRATLMSNYVNEIARANTSIIWNYYNI